MGSDLAVLTSGFILVCPGYRNKQKNRNMFSFTVEVKVLVFPETSLHGLVMPIFSWYLHKGVLLCACDAFPRFRRTAVRLDLGSPQ